MTPERISATLTGHAEILGAIDAGDQAAAETLIRRRIETSRSEIRKFTPRHMALASPAPGQARGTAPRRSKAARS